MYIAKEFIMITYFLVTMVSKPAILQVGAGSWGENHIRVWKHLESLGYCERITVTDINEDRLKYLSKKYVINTVENYEKHIEDFDAIDIVTPSNTHFNVSKKCLELGKHIFLEKPMTSTYLEAKKLIELSETNNNILMVGHIFRFHPITDEILKLISNNVLDDIRYIHGHFKGFKRPRMDVGVIGTDSIHFIDLICMYYQKDPKQITAITRDFLGRRLEDFSIVIMDFEPELGIVESGYFIPGKGRNINIMGKKKTLLADYDNYKFEIHKIKHEKQQNGWTAIDEGIITPVIKKEEPLKIELKHFVDCIKYKKKPLVDGIIGAKSIKIIEAAYKSIRLNKTVRV